MRWPASLQKGISFQDETFALGQKTLISPLFFSGVGIHTGLPVSVEILPDPFNFGYTFIRKDVDPAFALIPGSYKNVRTSPLCTQIVNEYGTSVKTIEHLLAALWGSGITSALIKVTGEEIPILDGSSKVFLEALEEEGYVDLPRTVPVLKIIKPIRFEKGSSVLEIIPSPHRKILYSFDGYQRMEPVLTHRFVEYDWDRDDFGEFLGQARTFGFYEDGLKLQAQGWAQGASLENTVVLKDGKILNQEGLRFVDEFVRHKVLDLIGDFALAGKVILGEIRAQNTGHQFNNEFLHYLFHNCAECFEEI